MINIEGNKVLCRVDIINDSYNYYTTVYITNEYEYVINYYYNYITESSRYFINGNLHNSLQAYILYFNVINIIIYD